MSTKSIFENLSTEMELNMNSAELMKFWQKHQNGRGAKEIFPSGGKNSKRLTGALANIAANLATAKTQRLQGNISTAQMYEGIAERISESPLGEKIKRNPRRPLSQSEAHRLFDTVAKSREREAEAKAAPGRNKRNRNMLRKMRAKDAMLVRNRFLTNTGKRIHAQIYIAVGGRHVWRSITDETDSPSGIERAKTAARAFTQQTAIKTRVVRK